MKQPKTFENYPAWIVLLSNLVSLAIYLIGALIIYKIGVVWLILYLLFIGIQEFRLIKGHCVNCYYVTNARICERPKNLKDFFGYGKTCAFGRSRICILLFKKGNNKKFCKKQMTWKDIIPDFMVSLIPVIIGIIMLIKDFNWTLLSLVIILLILAFFGNALIRGQLACKYCRQRQIGCPAQKLFEKKS